MAREEVNRRIQQHGKGFEKTIGMALAALEQLREVVYTEHSEPTWRQIGKGPPPSYLPQYQRTEASGADFYGILRDGMAYGVECKSVAPGEALDWRVNFTRKTKAGIVVPKRQVDHLEALRHGVLAIEWRNDAGLARVDLLPWRLVPWKSKGTAGNKAVHAVDALEIVTRLPRAATLSQRLLVALQFGSF